MEPVRPPEVLAPDKHPGEAVGAQTTDVALLGIFRSGTNYLRTLLELNYNCRLQNTVFGWKHGFHPSISRDSALRYPEVPVVVVVKSPAFAMYSLHRYYQQRHLNIRAGEDFDRFLRERIVFYDAFDRYAPEYRFPNPVQLWNGMNWHYASIKPRRGVLHVVRYEEALAEPERAAAAVAQALGLERKNPGDPFHVPENRTRNMADRPRQTAAAYVTPDSFVEKDFYLDRGYLASFTPDDMAFLAQEVDAELLARLGYDEV